MDDQNEFKDELIKKITSTITTNTNTNLWLLEILHDAVTHKHTPLSYKKSKNIILKKIYNRDKFNRYNSCCAKDKTNIKNPGFRINYVVPKKFFDKESTILGDIHIMYLTQNTTKNTTQNTTKNTAQNTTNIMKGELARSIAYFYIRYPKYRDVIEKKYLDIQTLILWNKSEPVNKSELIREASIHRYQRNHNPFILIPELIDIVFCNYIKKDIPMTDICLTRDNFYKQYTHKNDSNNNSNKSNNSNNNTNTDNSNNDEPENTNDDGSCSKDKELDLDSVTFSVSSNDNGECKIERTIQHIDKSKMKALRTLQAIKNPKTKGKKERERIKKKVQKVKKAIG